EAVAASLLSSAGFASEAVPAAGEPVGFVSSQDPGGFAWAAVGSKVRILVFKGAPTDFPAPPTPGPVTKVPSVLGRTEADALDLLKPWSVQLATVAGTPSTDGRVVDQ